MMTMSKRFIWSETDKEYLIAHYARTTALDLAKHFGCSTGAVYGKSNKMSLKKDTDFIVEVAKTRSNNPEHGSRMHRYKKGQTAWNKGMKGLYIGGVETQFKKGTQPPNALYDGAITIRKDNRNVPYQFIRLENRKWEHLHRHIWKQAFGDIPVSCVVAFKDKNTLNCVLENLELISKKDNMLRNSIDNYPDEIKAEIRTLQGFNRRLNTIKKRINNQENGK
jgi:HNH endonuclease